MAGYWLFWRDWLISSRVKDALLRFYSVPILSYVSGHCPDDPFLGVHNVNIPTRQASVISLIPHPSRDALRRATARLCTLSHVGIPLLKVRTAALPIRWLFVTSMLQQEGENVPND